MNLTMLGRVMAAVLVALAVTPLFAGVLTIPLGLDLYLPVPQTNPLTSGGIETGRRLFFDPRLSRDGTISCATCHRPGRAFSDDRPLAVGVFGRTGRRNAPALVNRGYGRAFFWDGRERTLEEMVLKPIQDPNEMDLSLDEAAERVGVGSDGMSRALASYVRSILSGNSAFDRFVYGDRTALTDEEQLGLETFRSKGNCTACHVGPNFSDEKLHNTGVGWRTNPAGAGPPGGYHADAGAGNATFKTPTLRDVAQTAPYMHDGSLATLTDVIEFYDGGGHLNPNLDPEMHPLRLTAAEKRGLVAFLEKLSGHARATSRGLE